MRYLNISCSCCFYLSIVCCIGYVIELRYYQ